MKKVHIILLVLILSIINNSNGLNIANRIVSLTSRKKDTTVYNSNNDIPTIVPLKEKKNIGTKVKGVLNNIIELPLVAVKSVKDITYITIDTASTIYDSNNNNILSKTPDSVISNIEITNIGNVGDAIVEFPSSIANDVTKSIDKVSSNIVSVSSKITSIPNNIVKTTTNVQRTVKSILKAPGIVLNTVKGVIDSIYDITDKINGIDSVPQTKGSLVYSINSKNNEKVPSDIIDEIKEAFFMTADTVTGTVNAVQDNVPKIINTIVEIPTIPTKVVTKYKQTEKGINDKVIEIQNDFNNAKENSIKIGNVFYKIITLEAAKETATRINNNYEKLVTSIDKTGSVIVGTKDFIVNVNKAETTSPKKESTVSKKINNTLSDVGETVKLVGGVSLAFGKIGFTIFKGIGRFSTITYKSIINIADNDVNSNTNNNLMIPDAAEYITPITTEKVKEKEGDLLTQESGEWK